MPDLHHFFLEILSFFFFDYFKTTPDQVFLYVLRNVLRRETNTSETVLGRQNRVRLSTVVSGGIEVCRDSEKGVEDGINETED